MEGREGKESAPLDLNPGDATEQNSVRSVNRKQNLRSANRSEANDRDKASHGLFATAELLVFILI